MTEPLDTAAIRARWLLTTHEGPKKLFEVFGDVAALCDALDAANAEIEKWHRLWQESNAGARKAVERRDAELAKANARITEQRKEINELIPYAATYRNAESIAADYRSVIQWATSTAAQHVARCERFGSVTAEEEWNVVRSVLQGVLDKHEKGHADV